MTDLRGRADRRSGTRAAFGGTPAFVLLPDDPSDAANTGEAGRVPVRIADYSVSGIGFFLDRRVALPPGTEITLEIGEALLPLRMSRSVALDRSRLTYHGAEFVEPGPTAAIELERVALHRVECGPDPRPAGPPGVSGLTLRQWVSPTTASEEDRKSEPIEPTPASMRRPLFAQATTEVRARIVPTFSSGSPDAADPGTGLTDDEATEQAMVTTEDTGHRYPTTMTGEFEQRIGARHDVRIPITLFAAKAKGRRRRSQVPVPAEIFNLSITGAGAVAASHPAIEPGTTVTIEIEGRRGQARIRRVADVIASGQTYFGLEFVDTDLEQVVSTLLDSVTHPSPKPA